MIVYIYIIDYDSVPTTGRMIPSGLIVHQQRYRPRDSIYIIDYDSVPTTGRMIPSGLIVHQQRYRPVIVYI